MRKPRENPDLRAAPKARKKAYSAPKLVQYGSILKLTQATGSGNGDTGMVMMTSCL